MKKAIFCSFFIVFVFSFALSFAQEWKPNFALQLYSYRMMTFEEAVKTAAGQGFKFVELYPGQKLTKDSNRSTGVTQDPETIKQIKEIMNAAGVTPVAYGVTGAGDEAGWRSLFVFVKELGIGVVQTEVGKNSETLDMIDKLAGEYGLKIALHNHTQKAGLPENALKEVEGRKNIGSGADTGHWAVAGVKPVEGVKLLSGKFNAMHLVDEKNIGNGSYVIPYGQGACQIGEILAELKKQGFNGPISLEYERVSDKLVDEISECVKWYNAYFENKK